ncbi:copper-binding protein [Salmonella enterica]
MRTYSLCMLTGVLLFSFSAAQAQNPHAMHDAMSQHSTSTHHAQVYQGQGIIKKISADSLTIAHQAIPALNWPPMTMQFSLQPGNALPPAKVGDKVSFSFVESEKGYYIVSLTPQK